MGVPDGAWYVGMHSREGEFPGDYEGSANDHRNEHRGFLDGIRHIVNQGGFVIRLGDRSMAPLHGMPQVIDYARGPHKSGRMDIFLLATCRYFIGTTLA